MLISKKAVAKILGVSSSTIYRWSINGTFPKPIVIGPNKTMWLKNEIEKFIESKASKRGFGGFLLRHWQVKVFMNGKKKKTIYSEILMIQYLVQPI